MVGKKVTQARVISRRGLVTTSVILLWYPTAYRVDLKHTRIIEDDNLIVASVYSCNMQGGDRVEIPDMGAYVVVGCPVARQGANTVQVFLARIGYSVRIGTK